MKSTWTEFGHIGPTLNLSYPNYVDVGSSTCLSTAHDIVQCSSCHSSIHIIKIYILLLLLDLGIYFIAKSNFLSTYCVVFSPWSARQRWCKEISTILEETDKCSFWLYKKCYLRHGSSCSKEIYYFLNPFFLDNFVSQLMYTIWNNFVKKLVIFFSYM